MTNGHKKRMIGRDEEMDRDVLGILFLFFVFVFIVHLKIDKEYYEHKIKKCQVNEPNCPILEELRVGDTRLASEEDLDGLSVAEVLNLISLRII